LIFGISLDVVNDVKSYLSNKFDMKDLGEAYMILRMKKNLEAIKGFL